VVFVSARAHGGGASIPDGFQAITFNLTSGLWGSGTNYTVPLPGTFPPFTNAWLSQLVKRGSADYILYFPGAKETVSAVAYSRLYYATFDGTTFGTATLLPGQAGVAKELFPALSLCGFRPRSPSFFLSAGMLRAWCVRWAWITRGLSAPSRM